MNSPHCSDCAPSALTRRKFLTSAGLAAASVPLIGREAAFAAEKPAAETLVTQLFKSLNDEQKKKICMPWHHALRTKVDNNWTIVPDTIAKALTQEQRALVKDIFMGLHSEEYAETVYGQVVHDSEGDGFDESCAVALFGEPGTGKFEFVLTGRHCTRRCDGDSTEGAAFGGPIFYGHAAESFNEKPDHPNNVYWYQAKRANGVFKMLDGKQREKALCKAGRPEKGSDTVKLSGKTDSLEGLAFADMTADQRKETLEVLRDLLKPFRKADSDEAMKCIEASGTDKLRMAFFQQGDIGNDQVWDVWQLEGPDMVWYFRGSPHVHVWAHIRSPKA